MKKRYIIILIVTAIVICSGVAIGLTIYTKKITNSITIAISIFSIILTVVLNLTSDTKYLGKLKELDALKQLEELPKKLNELIYLEKLAELGESNLKLELMERIPILKINGIAINNNNNLEITINNASNYMGTINNFEVELNGVVMKGLNSTIITAGKEDFTITLKNTLQDLNKNPINKKWNIEAELLNGNYSINQINNIRELFAMANQTCYQNNIELSFNSTSKKHKLKVEFICIVYNINNYQLNPVLKEVKCVERRIEDLDKDK